MLIYQIYFNTSSHQSFYFTMNKSKQELKKEWQNMPAPKPSFDDFLKLIKSNLASPETNLGYWRKEKRRETDG